MLIADIITEFLIQKGVKHVFGYQGGAIARVIHSISESEHIDYLQNYHEQASSFAASGYAKSSGKLGVAVATSGPGAVNMIAGITDSFCDSVPCLFITGQDRLESISNNSGARLNGFQDLDIVSMVRPVTKFAKLVTDENDIINSLEEAYFEATTGRKGPVLLDIPVDIQLKDVDLRKLSINKCLQAKPEGQDISILVSEVISHIKGSRNPVILCGGGVKSSGAQKDLASLLSILRIPTVATSNGTDVHPDIVGFSGLNGNTEANMTIFNSDLLVVLGSRFGQQQVGRDCEKYTRSKKIIHIDIDQSELGRVFKYGMEIKCDISIFLQELNKQLSSLSVLPSFESWNLEVAGYCRDFRSSIRCNSDKELDPVGIFEKLNEIIDDNAIVTLDVGQNQMWATQSLKLREGQRVVSGVGYSSMGCSIPYAIGSSYASDLKDNQVICINGDGGFQMNMQELMFISQNKLNIKIVVINNSGLGLIKATQDKYMDSKYYGTSKSYANCVDLKLLAKSYEIDFLRIDSSSDLENIGTLLEKKGPCLIECKVSFYSNLLTKSQ